jgi:integrase
MAAVEAHIAAGWSEPGPDGLVFPAPEGGPMRRSNFGRRVWRPATEAVGVPGLRFHDLRHTAGTLAAITGATTKELMGRIGHASPAAALRYQHATAERDASIADALDRLAASARPEPTTALHQIGAEAL